MFATTPTVVMTAGTRLWHGTDCAGEFTVPDGPAWVCFDRGVAAGWSNWRQQPPAGRVKGTGRVFAYQLRHDIRVLDTRPRADWQRLGLAVLDDPEPGPWTLACALKDAGEHGWLGAAELLLCEPHRHLELLGVDRPGRWTPMP